LEQAICFFLATELPGQICFETVDLVGQQRPRRTQGEIKSLLSSENREAKGMERCCTDITGPWWTELL
jgi:hypothetical protein